MVLEMSMETEHGAEYSGILSRKKVEHGMFEDPYKPKVKAWIGKTTMFIRPLAPDRTPVPGSLPEKLDLTIWKIGEREEKGKFSLIHPGGASIKLRADTQTEADAWVNQITTGIKRAKDGENQATMNRLNAEKVLRQQKEESAAKAKAEEDEAKERAEKAKREQEKAANEKAEREAAGRKQAELEQQRVAKEIQDALIAAQSALKAAQERASKEKGSEEAREKAAPLASSVKGTPPPSVTASQLGKWSPRQTAAVPAASTSPPAKVSAAALSDAKPIIVQLTEAQHLPQRYGGGACDAYAIVLIQDMQVYQTKVVANEYFAKWNEQFTVDAVKSREVVVEIYDKNSQEKDGRTYIGAVRIPISPVTRASEVSLPVLGRDGAALRGKDMQITMLSYSVVDPFRKQQEAAGASPGLPTVTSQQKSNEMPQVSQQTPSLVKSPSKAGNGEIFSTTTGMTAIKVLIEEVDHLPKMDVLGTCDSYAVASIGRQRFVTKTKWNSYYSRWNEEFEFYLAQQDGETLLVELFDKDKSGGDDFIGSVQIPLMNKEYARSRDGVTKKLPVLDKKGTGVRGNDNLITMLTVAVKLSQFSQTEPMMAPSQPIVTADHLSKDPSKNEVLPFKNVPTEDALVHPIGKQSGEIAPFRDPVKFELNLQMELVPGSEMEAFKFELINDLAQAANVGPKDFQIESLRAGSIIADVALSSDAQDINGRTALEIARGLEQQAKDPSSPLLRGKYTSKTVSLKVKGEVNTTQEVDEPKVPNHAQRMAAKLYAENTELSSRLKNIAEKLQMALNIAPSDNSPPPAPEIMAEEVLAKLASETHARDQAEAAFDLATADAMKHEAEKEEAIIDRDFLKNELLRQKDAHEKEMEAMQILTEELAATEVRASELEKAHDLLLEQNRKLIAEAEDAKNTVSGSTQEVEERMKQLDLLRSDLKEQVLQRESAVKECQEAQKRLQELTLLLETCKEELKAEREASQKMKSQLDLQQEHIKTLEGAIKNQEESSADVDLLKAELAEARTNEQQLKGHIQQGKQDKAELEQKISQLEADLCKAKPENSSLLSDCERLRVALSAEQKAKLELEERVHKLQGRIVGLQGDLDAARSERRELETLVTTLREDILDRDAPRKEREREIAREALAPRNVNAPRTPSHPTRPYAGGSPAAHLFMAGTLSGTPGKVAKILLGSSERHRLATSDYLASLLENTVEINRVGKGLVPEDMAEIAAYVLGHPRVERMFLSGNNLGTGGAKQLADLLCRDGLRLQRLDLRHNNLGNQGCLLLMESLKVNESLTRLDLSANGLTSVAANSIALAIRTSLTLVRLDLRHNELGDPGAAELADSLRNGSKLLHLDVSANAIGLKGAEALALALQANVVLEVLDIRGNALGATGVKLLEHAREASPLATRQILLPVTSRH